MHIAVLMALLKYRFTTLMTTRGCSLRPSSVVFLCRVLPSITQRRCFPAPPSLNLPWRASLPYRTTLDTAPMVYLLTILPPLPVLVSRCYIFCLAHSNPGCSGCR